MASHASGCDSVDKRAYPVRSRGHRDLPFKGVGVVADEIAEMAVADRQPPSAFEVEPWSLMSRGHV